MELENIDEDDLIALPAVEAKFFLRSYGVAWRWNLVEQHIRTQCQDDPSVCFDRPMQLAWAYLSNREPSVEALSTGYSVQDVRIAHQLRLDPMGRMHITARILARQTNQDIAMRCGVPRNAVAIYKQLFLDVDELLDHHASMFSYVIEPKRDFDVTRHTIWKLCYLAEEAAERVLEQVPHLGQPSDLTTPGGRLRERLELLIACERLKRDEPMDACRLLPEFQRLEVSSRNQTPTISELLAKQVDQTLARYLAGEPEIIPINTTTVSSASTDSATAEAS